LKGNWATVNNADAEVAAANYPNIRLFTVNKTVAFNPIDTINGYGWEVCSPETIKQFSATAYFFGRELHNTLNVPIGLIHSSWGGTIAEAWTSINTLGNQPDYAERANLIAALKISPDSLKAKYEADVAQRKLEIADADAGISGNDTIYANPQTLDSSWIAIDLPKLWEETELGVFDGSGWFYKTVNLTAAQAKSDITLHYGAPDDADEAWFNGVYLGHNEKWDVLREYAVPAGVAKAGKNVIVLRVMDYQGGGGFMGKPEQYFLQVGKAKLPLAKGWLMKKGFDFKDVKTTPISPSEPNQPCVLFNGMINPLIPYAIKGAIWYQGESNSGMAYQYRSLFKAMITDWRTQWGQGDFPFYFVQLANYQQPSPVPVEDSWAELREAQLLALELPNTGMAVSIDIGDALDIHPGNKQDVGKRLALNALAKTYNINIPYSGPIYNGFEVKNNKIVLRFNHVYNGLLTSDNKALRGFAIASADQKFVWADAVIVDSTVVVSTKTVTEPVAVRYNWHVNPQGNLVNSAGLPASPFRTDSWKGITQP
jgi:sialate O-acetylesterase